MAKKNICSTNQGGSAIYGIGGVGALVYFLQKASGAEEVIFGILKALVWPAFLVYKLMGFLGM